MDRIVGIETEYGCLMSSEELRCNSEVWPAKVKNYLFNKVRAGTIDLHYRDYEEPPGNGGFLLNGGRLYLDMGHIEYASPECLHLHDLVTYEMAGDELLRSSLAALEAGDRVSFIENNVDHHTGATFGCHENYLMKREAQFTPSVLGTLLEQRQLPRNLVLNDAVRSTRDISRDATRKWIVDLENGKTIGALDVQWQFHDLAQRHLRGRDAETDWLLETWSFVLESIEQNPQALIGGVDWITKKWLLETFMASEKVGWDDPWLQSLDLEYHNIDPVRGLFFGVMPGKRVAEWNNSFQPANAIRVPPANTRASGRARAVAYFQDRHQPYVINWDSIAHDSRDFLVMGDPFETYNDEVDKFLAKPRPVTNHEDHE